MTELIIVLLFLLWYGFSLAISESVGKARRIGVERSFFLCMVLSPVAGYVITRMSKIR
jgi:hypothetical protein